MKTKNQFRSEKMKEIQKIWDIYPDLALHERLFIVLDELVRKALRTGDYQQLASLNELARVFEGLFINPKTGHPTADAINWIRKLVTMIRKDKSHPHIRPYTEPHTEIDVSGQEIVRWYLNLLIGSKAVTQVNLRLEKQKTGISETQKANKENANPRKVMKEAEEYAIYLKQKQQDANDRKRKDKRR